jgi:hypothetical protein
VEDWEQFFAEKSRRRADKERLRRRRQRNERLILGVSVGLLLIGAIVALSIAT